MVIPIIIVCLLAAIVTWAVLAGDRRPAASGDEQALAWSETGSAGSPGKKP